MLSSLKNDPGLAFCSASMYGQNCGFLGAWHFVGHLLGNCLHFGDDFLIALVFIDDKGCQGNYEICSRMINAELLASRAVARIAHKKTQSHLE